MGGSLTVARRAGATPAATTVCPLALAVLLTVLGARPAHAQSAVPSEYAVKAAFLYNFARYVEWPPEALARTPDKLVVCVLGEDPFGFALDRTLAGKTLGERTLVPRRVTAPDDVAQCHLVFVGATDELSEALRVARNAAVLTVGDGEDFARRGGMIQLVKEGSRIRFAINLGGIERAGLKISSEVLKLATDVLR